MIDIVCNRRMRRAKAEFFHEVSRKTLYCFDPARESSFSLTWGNRNRMTTEEGGSSMEQKFFNRKIDRRRFLQLTKAFGYTAVIMTAVEAPFFTEEAVAQTAKEESERKKAFSSTHWLSSSMVSTIALMS